MIPRYRAWNKATKEMYEDDDIVDIDLMKSQIHVKTPFFEQINCYRLRDVDTMSSTGFTDKDGKDIFRDDIVISRCGLFKGIVIFDQNLREYVIRLIGYKNRVRLRTVANTVKVIGNFYENPELWKDEQ